MWRSSMWIVTVIWMFILAKGALNSPHFPQNWLISYTSMMGEDPLPCPNQYCRRKAFISTQVACAQEISMETAKRTFL